MEGARVAAAVRQIVDETGRREPRAGRNVLMLAWLEGELDGLFRIFSELLDDMDVELEK